MTKRNIPSFEPFFGDESVEGQISSPFFDERSKSLSHENRFQTAKEALLDFEKTQKTKKTEEIKS